MGIKKIKSGNKFVCN